MLGSEDMAVCRVLKKHGRRVKQEGWKNKMQGNTGTLQQHNALVNVKIIPTRLALAPVTNHPISSAQGRVLVQNCVLEPVQRTQDVEDGTCRD